MSEDELETMKKYVVFLDEDGNPVGRPRYTKYGSGADGLIENKPVDAVTQEWNTKEELLKHIPNLCKEDFPDTGEEYGV